MSEAIYKKLAKVLDTLPNGFPATESGIELTILKSIFSPEDVDIFCDLRLAFETPEQISERTGRSLDGLEDKLMSMWDRGLVFGVDFGTAKLFKMIPWVVGIYEYQLKYMTKEFAQMCEDYAEQCGRELTSFGPQLMQVVPIEEEIPAAQEQVALPYERISELIEKNQSFAVNDCICKKERELLDKPCDKPMEVCLAMAPIPGIFKDHPFGMREITKDEAYEVLRVSEEAGLVHLTSNVQNGNVYICNCCGCCCGVLRNINELGVNAQQVVNAHYYAKIDTDACVSCGVCKDERCQVDAIEENDDTYTIIKDKCIGCGVCISSCPSEAISLLRKDPSEITAPPETEDEWFQIRGGMRGVDYTPYV